eukprot:CAMPEP_0170604218 /NCGR_PEP_ID=MMETSP0224-20130122/19307_1 /TAXON_ID=285029 /ORGANISM="Togula jolla, Strain CCCM 725" /LENGTH=593 /DNA_ID=CAMNT_0010929109 /DNA_START=59 /DNA_END=1837 /DNA_ORIENTATION=-
MRNHAQIQFVQAILLCQSVYSFGETFAGTKPSEAFFDEGLPGGLQLLQLSAQKNDEGRTGGKKKPNVLFILADDLGFANVGYLREGNHVKSREVQTPVIDDLAKTGVRLNRMYVHYMCSPTRSAIQSGRAPINVNVLNSYIYNHNPEDPVGGYAGIPRNMTGLAELMRRGGYDTHYVGKWDAGAATPDHSPAGRGYDTSLHYFGHSNDAWTFNIEDVMCSSSPVADLFEMSSQTPFPGRPATWLQNPDSCTDQVQDGCMYEDEIFAEKVQAIIQEHNEASPFFIFWAPRVAHGPLQVPENTLSKFSFVDYDKRRIYTSMVNWLDTRIGYVVQLLKDRNMYENTLIIFSSDNGGPVDAGANNFPLRGGKYSNFDGGIRVPSFVSGGFVPEVRRGSWHDGLMAAWDWYATLAGLAQVDHTDHKAAAAGLPATDSFDLWPTLSTWDYESPRTELVLGNAKGGYAGRHEGSTVVGGLIWPPYKLVLGAADGYGESVSLWSAPIAPNASSTGFFTSRPDAVCGRTPQNGCLFNIWEDEGEHNNLAQSQPGLFEELVARADEMQKTVYSPVRGQDGDSTKFLDFCKANIEWGRFYMRPW